MRADAAIIGGGIVGCATAYYLARAGASVVLLERGRIGEGASGAAAGMLAPLCEAKQAGPYMDLLVAALRDYSTAAPNIEAASGLPTGYRKSGILRTAFTGEEAERLEAAACLYEQAGLPYRRLTPEQARSAEPGLNPDIRAAILSPDEGQIYPRAATAAFRRGAELAGARLCEFAEVTGIETESGRAYGVRVADGVVEAETVVLAAGAWSPLVGEGLDIPVPVMPVRGQMAAVRNLPVAVRHVLYSFGGYAVPWPDGRLALGATMEEAGYAARTTLEGIEQVLGGARRKLPGLRHAELDATWAGLRPGSADGLPLLGAAPGLENLWLATGHFRSGILLGPYTARLLAKSIRAGSLAPELEEFSPGRITG
jgi:glycine oxidase